MKAQIGDTAGRIWEALSSADQVAVSQLPKMLKEREAVVYQAALGWLAREDKVEYRQKGNRTFVYRNN